MLAKIEAPGAFATRRTTSTDDLHLEVKGVGRITGLDLDQVTRRIQRLPGVDGPLSRSIGVVFSLPTTIVLMRAPRSDVGTLIG